MSGIVCPLCKEQLSCIAELDELDYIAIKIFCEWCGDFEWIIHTELTNADLEDYKDTLLDSEKYICTTTFNPLPPMPKRLKEQ